MRGGWNETPPQTKASSYSIMNCFQHTPESCGAFHNPHGEHHTKKAFLHKHALTGFTTHAYSFKRLALLRLLQHLPFFAWPNVRYTCTPTSPRSTGFCTIWDSISSSSSSPPAPASHLHPPTAPASHLARGGSSLARWGLGQNKKPARTRLPMFHA